MTTIDILDRLDVSDAKTHRFTRTEYNQMAAMGFFDDKRVELIEGEILDIPPQTNPHALSITIMNRFLTQQLGDEFMIRCQLPFAAAEEHEPEPDFAVLRCRVEDLKDHPTTALVVIEIAYDSLRRDLKKAAIYAQAGVQEYWIINLRSREIIQHTIPRPAMAVTGEPAAKYTAVRTFSAAETICCTVLPLPPRQVESLLPPY